jgi:hypothetical protein
MTILDHISSPSWQTLLLLKGPDTEYPWHRMVWRRGVHPDLRESSLWASPGEIWWLPATVALDMMQKAVSRGWCVPAHRHWTHERVEVFDSSRGRTNFAELAIDADHEPDRWRARHSARTVICKSQGEPGWAKAIVIWPNQNESVLRTLRHDQGIEGPGLNGAWRLHPVMTDATPRVFETHLEALDSALRDGGPRV